METDKISKSKKVRIKVQNKPNDFFTPHDLQINIPQYKEISSNIVLFYVIEVTLFEHKWYLEKRFSQFDALYKKILDDLKKDVKELPFLPPKRIFYNKKPNFLDDRKVGLTLFLNTVITIPQILEHPIFQAFLQINKNYIKPSPTKIEDPKQFQETKNRHLLQLTSPSIIINQETEEKENQKSDTQDNIIKLGDIPESSNNIDIKKITEDFKSLQDERTPRSVRISQLDEQEHPLILELQAEDNNQIDFTPTSETSIKINEDAEFDFEPNFQEEEYYGKMDEEMCTGIQKLVKRATQVCDTNNTQIIEYYDLIQQAKHTFNEVNRLNLEFLGLQNKFAKIVGSIQEYNNANPVQFS